MNLEAMRIWDAVLRQGPVAVHSCEPVPGAPGMEAVYYEGLPWQERETRVFAYLGVPPRTGAERVPAMVLVHGGGGTAFPDWVRAWMDRGFAAIAMDCCGCKGGGKHADRPRHEWGGPPQSVRAPSLDGPIADEWMTHAVAAVIRGHSLLRNVAGVDSLRVGLTGVSWGGVLACVAAGVDSRFALAVPVYGCGYVSDYDSGLLDKLPPPDRQDWKDAWDPAGSLPGVRCPMLWVNGTNDLGFSMPSVVRSSRLTGGERTLSLQHRLPHGHQEGWAPREIAAFVESHLAGGSALTRIVGQGAASGRLCVAWQSGTPVVRAEVFHTEDTGHWRTREWSRTAATARGRSGELTIHVPSGSSACFLNLTDDRGLAVSSDLF
jgi:dienelactone hydrolase